MHKLTAIYNSDGEILEHKEEKYSPTAEFGKGKKFIKLYICEEVEFSKDFFYRTWYFLVKRLEMGTNLVIDMDTKEYITMKNMVDSGIPKTSLYLAIKEFKEKGYIKEVSQNGKFVGFCVNPIYAFNGDYMEIITYELFKSKELDKFMEENKMRIGGIKCQR